MQKDMACSYVQILLQYLSPLSPLSPRAGKRGQRGKVIKLINVLFIRYPLDCTLRFHTPTQPRIYIKESSMSKLIAIVEPYMHHSLTYKLYKNHRGEVSGIRGKNKKKNIGTRVLDENGGIIYSFPSITDCALFFNVDKRTVTRRIFKGSFTEFNGKILKFEHEMN